MQCFSPIYLPETRLTVPCGRCAACLKRKQSAWSLRLNYEQKEHKYSYFITLTYSDECLPVNGVNKTDIQLFMKRLRKKIKCRYFLTSEYGSKTHRAHYHLILFTDNSVSQEIIVNAWQNGNVQIGSVTPASINYVTKYALKKSFVPKGQNSCFSLQSRKPGIGYNYIKRMKSWHEEDLYRNYSVMPGGHKIALPRYLREKIYTKEEMEHQSAKTYKSTNYQTPQEFKLAEENKEYLTRLINNFENEKI